MAIREEMNLEETLNKVDSDILKKACKQHGHSQPNRIHDIFWNLGLVEKSKKPTDFDILSFYHEMSRITEGGTKNFGSKYIQKKGFMNGKNNRRRYQILETYLQMRRFV